MNRSRVNRLYLGTVTLSLIAMTLGCFGGSETYQADRETSEGTIKSPISEAFIEYSGPSEKWGGPQSFVMHLALHGKNQVQVSTVPDHFKINESEAAQKLSPDLVKAHFTRLHLALQGKDQPFEGCLYPVGVKIIRQDGSMLEKRGCRSSTGWPKTASEVVDQVLKDTIQPESPSKQK